MEYISVKELILPWAYRQDKPDGLFEDIEGYMETGDMESLSNEDIFSQFQKYGLKIAEKEIYICENQAQDNPGMIMYMSQFHGECYGIYYGDYTDGERTGNGTWYYED